MYTDWYQSTLNIILEPKIAVTLIDERFLSLNTKINRQITRLLFMGVKLGLPY